MAACSRFVEVLKFADRPLESQAKAQNAQLRYLSLASQPFGDFSNCVPVRRATLTFHFEPRPQACLT